MGMEGEMSNHDIILVLACIFSVIVVTAIRRHMNNERNDKQ
jgi:hypothetical protein